jgi:hydroxymethylpyrimidine/phosphomethylpyrimidine kinase
MIAGSGDRLIDEDAVAVLRRELIPLATLVTPNSEEAEALVGRGVKTTEDAARAAALLVREYGAAAALVKGGHIANDAEIVDILFTDRPILIRGARLESRTTHGTGCTLSAAITAALALGVPLDQAVRAGIDFVRGAIAGAPKLGRGNGPLNHGAQLPAGFPRAERNSVTSD